MYDFKRLLTLAMLVDLLAMAGKAAAIVAALLALSLAVGCGDDWHTRHEVCSAEEASCNAKAADRCTDEACIEVASVIICEAVYSGCMED